MQTRSPKLHQDKPRSTQLDRADDARREPTFAEFGLLQYPLTTLQQYLLHFPRAARNTGIVLAAFWRTAWVGSRAMAVLVKNHERWSERTRGRYIWWVARSFWARWILARADIEVEIVGADRIDWSQPHVVVANHQSTLDILALVASIPSGRFVAKKEVQWYPFIGAAARRGGQIIIDRSNHRQAMAAIRRGIRTWPDCNLIFFAEGTRTRTGELGAFRKGAFAIARELDLSIVPVAISGTYAALPKGSLLRLKKSPRVRVEYGAPCAADLDVPWLCDRTRRTIAGMLAAGSVPC